jgi:hypothetical protein
MYTHVSSNNNNMTMVEPPFMSPMVQTSHRMPSFNQTTPSNYHINQYPDMNNNSMLMQTPVFVQGSNVATPSQFIQNSNRFSEPVPSPAYPYRTPIVLPVQTTSTRQPFTEEVKPILRPTFLYPDMPQPYAYQINGIASNVHGQYLMKSPQMVRPNLAPAIKQEVEHSHVAAYNTSERPNNSTNQATCTTMTQIYAKQQKESCCQQQQQQCDEIQIFDLLNNIPPLIPLSSHQDVDEASLPLLPLPSSHDRVAMPMQTVSTAADVQYQEGKLIILCFHHVCIFCTLQCNLTFGQYTHTRARARVFVCVCVCICLKYCAV